MPARCVAYGCSNTPSNDISLFKFPDNPVLKELWTQEVQKRRAHWTPSAYSTLCSAHFEERYFEPSCLLKVKLGMKTDNKKVLLPDAVPTIFPPVCEVDDKATTCNLSKHRAKIPVVDTQCENAIRCTLQSCRCDCFQPGKAHVRTCDTCKHGWVAHALDKLGFRSMYQMGVQVEVVQPSVVFDIASLMLYGAQATPIRLKILLDRLFSVLQHEEVLQVLHGFGWSYEDYARGYILQDASGQVLDKWNLCSREEEQVILQQFLRFGETKAIAQEIILQDARESHSRHLLPNHKSESDIKKFLERSSGPTTPTHISVSPSPGSNATAAAAAAAAAAALRSYDGRYPIRFPPNFGLLPASKLFSPMALASYAMPTAAAIAPPSITTSAPSPVKDSPNKTTTDTTVKTPSSSAGPGSPLSRLQTMQPFDYRREKHSPAAISPGASSEKSVPKTPSGSDSPQNLSVSSAGSLASPQNTHLSHSMKEANKLGFSPSKQSMPSDLMYPLDFSIKEHNGSGSAASTPRSHFPGFDPKSAGSYSDEKSRNNIRKVVPNMQRRNYSPTPGYGGTLVSPSGKKRVLCTACNKTFCDKGALKIHYSAVHLKEMHKCTVDGCNMMFSSRRSRNRHSANPNPKLHMPQNRRKLPDGAVVLDDKNPPPHLPTSLPELIHPMGPMQMTSNHMDIKPITVMPMPFSHLPQMTPIKHQRPNDLMPPAAKIPKMENDMDQVPRSTSSPVFMKRIENEYQNGETMNGGSKSKRKSGVPTRCAQVEDMYAMSDDNSMEGISVSEGEDPMLGSVKSQSSLDDGMSQDDDDEGISIDAGAEEYQGKSELDLSGSDSPKHDHYSQEDKENNDVAHNREHSKFYPYGSHPVKPIMGLDGVYEEALDMSKVHRNVKVDEAKYGHDLSMDEDDDNTVEDDSDDDIEIPVDQDDPCRCPGCGQHFPSTFAVRAHYQGVHLQLQHTCTVEGCNAAFPSKRSRDRHSANLNLHRKLLSTSSMADGKIGMKSPTNTGQSLRDEFLARIYDPQHMTSAFAAVMQKKYNEMLSANGFNTNDEKADENGLDTNNSCNGNLSKEEECNLKNKSHPNSENDVIGGDKLTGSSSNSNHDDDKNLNTDEENNEKEKNRSRNASSDLDSSFDYPDNSPRPDPQGQVECHVCSLRFRDNLVLKEHFEKVHPKEMYHCTVQGCDKIFSTRKSRNRHSQNENLHRHITQQPASLL